MKFDTKLMSNASKTVILVFVLMTPLAILFLNVAVSQSDIKNNDPTTIDSTYFPISDTILKNELASAVSNPVKMYGMLRRAGMQKKEMIALNEMTTLKQENPKNAIVLAGYCMAYDIAQGDYQINGRHAVLPFDEHEQDEYPKIISLARTLSPHLWMIYAVEGMHFENEAGAQNTLLKSSLEDFKKAVFYGANVSYTHSLLAESYVISYQTVNAFQYGRCAQEAETAIRLKPVVADPAWTLFLTYAAWLPNRDKAIQAKRMFYSRIPKNTILSKEAQEAFDHYPS